MPVLRPLEIIGGGLAGLSLGFALRREGVPVTIHEAGDYPRHRVCGEFISGLAATTIERLGILPLLRDALRHEEVAWSIGGWPPMIRRLPAPALGLSRHTLDARLAAAFVAAGGELRTHSRVIDIKSRPGRIFAHGRRRTRAPQWIGLKLHVRDLPLTRGLEMHLGTAGYVGLAQIETGEVNVCGLFRPRRVAGRGPEVLLGHLRGSGLAALADRVAAASPDAGSFCAVAAVGFDHRVSTPRGLIALGDAAAMIPPFTGNGMAMAFQGAEAALPGLFAYARGESDWEGACTAAHDALRRRFRLRLASAGALHPFLLRRNGQRCVAALGRARLLPFGPLYSVLH